MAFKFFAIMVVFNMASSLPGPIANVNINVEQHVNINQNSANSCQKDFDLVGVGDAGDKSVADTTTIVYHGTTIIETTINQNECCTPRRPNNKCPIISDAWKTRDTDGDCHMDSCDNCPNVANIDQADADSDLVGDACDTDQDTDNDGYQDGVDNCINVVNPEQSDADQDGLGDKCDDDADNDGIPNDSDNCFLYPNPAQEDTNNNGIGDVCEENLDFDGDCAYPDVCPYNSKIYEVNFEHFIQVDLRGTSHGVAANWIINGGGKEITQTLNADSPSLMYGQDSFSGVDFDGTLYVDNSDDDYAGLVFGYQSSSRFYTLMWKKHDQSWPSTNHLAKAGLQLKKVQSATGPSEALFYSLWTTGDSPGQLSLLWNDTNGVGWERQTRYNWQLIHRPVIGLIRARFLSGADDVIADTGNIFDIDIKGGHLGVYCHSQRGITWSALEYSCNDDSVPQEVYDELPVDKQANIKVDSSKSWAGKVKISREIIKKKPIVAYTEPPY